MNGAVLITGSSTGFGRRTAERLAEAGHTVYASMRATDGHNRAHAGALRARAAERGLALHVVEMDVTDEGSVARAVAQVLEEAGEIGALVNNAGIWGPGVLEAFSMAEWAKVFEANLFGSVRAIRAVLPSMRRRGEGLVVQVSSLQGRFILPYSGPYVASKFAVEAMAETFRYEVAPHGVDVCIVEPGDFMTEMKDKAAGYAARDGATTAEYGDAGAFIQASYLTPNPERAGNPEDVVDAIVALVEMPAGSRPVRTTVGNPIPQIEEINRLSQEMHAGLFPYIGLGDLLTLHTRPAGDRVAAD